MGSSNLNFKPAPPFDRAPLGFLFAIFLHIAVGALIFLAFVFNDAFNFTGNRQVEELAIYWFFGIGLSQLLYLLPAALIAHQAKWHRFAKGIWIACGVGFLLCAACFGMLGGLL